MVGTNIWMTAGQVKEEMSILAIMIDTNRPKDRERIGKLIHEGTFDQKILESIVDRYGLRQRWEKLIEST